MTSASISIDPMVDDYLVYLRSQGRDSTARINEIVLRKYVGFLARHQEKIVHPSTPVLDAYRLHLTTPEATHFGKKPYDHATQATHMTVVRSFYRWLRVRKLIVGDPVRDLRMPLRPGASRIVRKDYLDQQEAQAFLDTMAALVAVEQKGTVARGRAMRDFAMIAVAIATGRRRAGLCGLRLADVDLDRGELRVEREKGKVGRVLPMPGWAVKILRIYVVLSRPLVLQGRNLPWLFVGTVGEQVSHEAFAALVRRVHDITCQMNPDLRDLPHKHITTHGLRVTCARLLFANGCPIRSINEILLHANLSTTARYTPIPVEELRRVLATSHPRA